MEKIAWLFPLIFMFHDMEEIIGFRFFLERNRELLEKKYPKMLEPYKDFSTEGFALAVFEEFIICIAFSAILAFTNNDYIFDLWFGGFIGCTLHFVIHIGQSLVLRKYIPALATSVLCLPISVYIIIWSIDNIFQVSVISIVAVIVGIMIVGINLKLAQKLIGWFTRITRDSFV